MTAGDTRRQQPPPRVDRVCLDRRRHLRRGPERLIGVRAEMSEQVMIHSGGGQMARIEALDIPGEDAILFEPNGNHIMLTDLRAPLLEDDTFLVQLEFEKGGSQSVSVEVLAANAVWPTTLGAADAADDSSGETQ